MSGDISFMKKKFLPIGTICKLKKSNNKIMIVGYYSINYNGIVKLYDYSGLLYPEGMLNNQVIAFNHSDIDSVDFLGYVSTEYDKLNLRLTKNIEKYSEDKEVKNNYIYNFKFDENGVVIFDPMVGSNYDNVGIRENDEKPKEGILNPFCDRYESKLNENNNMTSDEWPIFPKNKFEE